MADGSWPETFVVGVGARMAGMGFEIMDNKKRSGSAFLDEERAYFARRRDGRTRGLGKTPVKIALFRSISKKRRPLANLCEAAGHNLDQNSPHETSRKDRSPLGLAL